MSLHVALNSTREKSQCIAQDVITELTKVSTSDNEVCLVFELETSWHPRGIKMHTGQEDTESFFHSQVWKVNVTYSSELSVHGWRISLTL